MVWGRLFVVVEKKTNIFCGVVSLSNIDYLNQSCEFGVIMGEEIARNIKTELPLVVMSVA